MAISSALGGTIGAVPAGGLMPFAGSIAPAGWLLCAGQAVSRSQYGELFATIGTAYGVGDGSTTFNLPDLRGRVVAGVDNMGGSDAGRLDWSNTLGTSGGTQTHTLTTSEIPSHTHTASGAATSVANSNNSLFMGAGNPPVGTVGNIGSTGGGGAHNNMQPTLLLNYIIKV